MLINHFSKFLLTLTAFLFLSGCQTYRYIPSTGEVAPSSASPSIPVAFDVQEAHLESNKRVAPMYWDKMRPEMARIVASKLDRLDNGSVLYQAPTLGLSLEASDHKMHWGSLFLYIVTLTLVPGINDVEFDSVMTVNAGDQELFRSQTDGKLRSYLSVYFPTPMFIGKMNPKHASGKMTDDFMTQHLNKLNQWVLSEKDKYDNEVAGKDIYQQREWLQNHPGSLFADELLHNFANNAPSQNPLQWHRENVALFPGYRDLLSSEEALWFVGPQGQQVIDFVEGTKKGESQKILVARASASGPYKAFTATETLQLKRMGLSDSLIAAMIDSQHHQPAADQARQTSSQTPNKGMVTLLINDNSGAYMNPWTSDGVLAEWVDKAINAKMGSAVGSAAGAYAASKALENVPFVGGFLGSKVGKEVGRKAAISASGGMEYIRTTSDQSFNSLADMAKYLTTVYATDSNFQDAIKAADAIYPGLMKEIARSQ